MAHFAEIDTNNIVLRVIVVSNADTSDKNGVEQENIGAAFCQSLFGGMWKQTSYNSNIRKNYAGTGYVYDASRNAFIPPQPYLSWVLNETTCCWQAPVPMPNDGKMYEWNESNLTWVEVNISA